MEINSVYKQGGGVSTEVAVYRFAYGKDALLTSPHPYFSRSHNSSKSLGKGAEQDKRSW